RPVAERVADLLGRMTLAEKLAQLGSVWVGAAGDGADGFAPMQHEFSAELPPLDDLIQDGMGQLTRVFGTRPVPPTAGMLALAGPYGLGLQAAGVDATFKHFAGYSASRGGRNMAPVSIGRREFADVILPPFEMAIRLGGARSVMPTYIDLDGVPATADGELIGGLLRTELGFDGLVVSDYYAVSFLEQQHSVAAGPSAAG